MDLSGIPMDLDDIDTPDILSYDPSTSSDNWTDHVKWQGSQTACSALNQLIKSSVDEASQEAPRTSGWQRVSSYDRLSSCISTRQHTTANSSSRSRPPSSKPSVSSRPHPRTRLSEAQRPDPNITNLDLPLFNKTNPMQFLDIMKGVSARLDENAGVRPRKQFTPAAAASSSSRAKKRARGISLGGTSELHAAKATRGVVKKIRMDELRTTGNLTWEEGDGKARATSEDEGLDSEVRGRGLQTHSSLPDLPSRSHLQRSLSLKDASFMYVDDNDDAMGVEHVSHSAVSSSPNQATPCPRTLSQAVMPPPPVPCDPSHKQPQLATDTPRQQSSASSVSTPFAISKHSNTINKPQTLCPPPQQPPTNYSTKQQKADAIPKLHPLLYHKPGATKASSSSTPQVQPRHHPAPIPASESVNLKPPPSSFTPLFSSTPSSRPPPLGMRRNHTLPSRASSSSSTIQQESSSLTSSGGQLPQRQKGFKPPLLSLSQPQTQTQTHDHSRAKSNANVIIIESGSTIAASKRVSSHNLPEASSTNNHGTNTSIALRSSTLSSESSNSFQSTPSRSHSHSSESSKSDNCKQGSAHPPQEPDIPEPLDGDPDSSFGDMSFDMDALEETMKLYD